MTLDFGARAVVQVLSIYALAAIAISAVATLPGCVRWAGAARHPRSAARRLFALRMAPSLGGAVLAFVGVPIVVWLWEPRLDERVGPAALIMAAAGAALLTLGAGRLVAALLNERLVANRLSAATRSTVHGGRARYSRIDAEFPIVALVGLIRPRLFVESRVADGCTVEELDAVLAHEMAHARAGDNLRRLLMCAAPDLLAWGRAGAGIERQWTDATERAADEAAAGHDSGTRLLLASALVKVARLATGALPDALPSCAFYRGGGIAWRVTQLAEAAPLEPKARPRVRTGAALLVAAIAALSLSPLFSLVEAIIAFGR